MPTKTLTLDEAAERLSLSASEVLAMIRSRRLHGLRVDGAWRVRAAEVEALVAEQLRESSASVTAEAMELADHYRACHDDARLQLKAGDLFARWGTLSDAIQCYDRRSSAARRLRAVAGSRESPIR